MRCSFFRFVFSLMAVITFASAREAHALDVDRFELLKGIYFYQIEDGVARLQTNNAYRFSAQVNADIPGDVLSASITTPKAQNTDLIPDADGDPFRFRDKFDIPFRLDNKFPNGTYQLAIRGLHDGDHVMDLTLTGDVYPAGPILNNYAGLQQLPYNQYNQISWQPFPGATTSDFIQLQIEDFSGNNVWETPDFGEAGALSGVDTITILPAETLQPGQIYFGTLRFVKVLQSTSRQYLGAQGTAGYFSRTEFTIRPVATDVTRVIDRVQIWKSKTIFPDPDGVVLKVAFGFLAKVDAVTSNQVSGVTLTLPNGEKRLLNTNEFNDQFELSEAASPAESAGSYIFDVGRPDHTTNHLAVDFPLGEYPQLPTLQNLSTYEGRPATDDLVISWLPWTNAAPSDFIRVELFDGNAKVWDTSNYSGPKHLQPTATTVTVPGTNMVAGRDYTFVVHFFRVTISDTRLVPGGIVFGGYDSSASFRFATRPPDVKDFGIALGQTIWQEAEDIFAPDPNGQFRFEASAEAQTLNRLRSAQLIAPNSGIVQLNSDASALKFSAFRPESSLSSLQGHYPTGVYEFQFDTVNDGLQVAGVNLFTNALPPVPHLRNFTALRSFSADKSIQLRADPWLGANTNTDSIVLTITNMFQGKSFSAGATFNTNQVTISIPAGSLARREFYVARLRFERKVESEDPRYPSVAGAAAVYSELAFTFTTLTNYSAAAPVQLPTGEFNFSLLNVLSNRTYRFNFSRDLINWNSYNFVTNRSVPAVTITRPASDHEFFRADLLAN
jgi:hypothetical protein